MSEWKEYRLGDILSIKSGFSYKGKYIGTGDSLLLGMGCVSFKEKFLMSGARPYSGPYDERYKVHAGDIVLATRQQSDNLPILAMPAMVPDSLQGKDIVIGTNLYKVEITDTTFSNVFIYWLLKTKQYVNYIAGVKTGTTVSMVTKKNVEDFTFFAPVDPKEREEIASIMSSLDDKIAVNKKICENLEAQAQALFKHWFVDFAPFKDGKFVKSEVGMIPCDWEYKSILENEYFRLCKSKVLPFSGEKKYYATANVDGNELCGKPEIITYDNRPSRADIVPCNNSIWFARMSKSYKILNCFGASKWLADEAIISTGFCGFTTNPDYYGFIYTYLISETFDKLKDLNATGTTQISLTNQGLSNIKVLLPPKSEIIKFSKIVHPLLEKIEICKYENIRLSETRDLLIPRLMSGQIKL